MITLWACLKQKNRLSTAQHSTVPTLASGIKLNKLLINSLTIRNVIFGRYLRK